MNGQMADDQIVQYGLHAAPQAIVAAWCHCHCHVLDHSLTLRQLTMMMMNNPAVVAVPPVRIVDWRFSASTSVPPHQHSSQEVDEKVWRATHPLHDPGRVG